MAQTAPPARRKKASPPTPARRSPERRTGPRPEPTLRILETRILRGPNYWAREPVVRMVVDLGVLEEFPSHLIPEVIEVTPGGNNTRPGLQRKGVR